MGKPKPVTLVATVVTRKSAVHLSSRRPAISPNSTTSPDRIPTRLTMTCTVVKADVVRRPREAGGSRRSRGSRCRSVTAAGGPFQLRGGGIDERGFVVEHLRGSNDLGIGFGEALLLDRFPNSRDRLCAAAPVERPGGG